MLKRLCNCAIYGKSAILYYEAYFAGKCLIISSEVLPRFQDAEWQPLINKSFIEISFDKLEYKIHL